MFATRLLALPVYRGKWWMVKRREPRDEYFGNIDGYCDIFCLMISTQCAYHLVHVFIYVLALLRGKRKIRKMWCVNVGRSRFAFELGGIRGSGSKDVLSIHIYRFSIRIFN